MYRNMDEWSEIRRRVLVEGVSRRQILRETKMHWLTLKKILEHSQPPGYRQQMPRRKTKLGDYLKRIEEILKEDQAMPRKQRHTAKRIWERLREDGFTGGYTVVKDAVRDLTQRNQEVFVPLVHRPGEAQVDFGHALARVNGRLRKVAFFVMALPYSDASFVMAFERECTETFWEGHVQAFEFFKGVPRRITYDNTKVAVSQILGRARRLTQGFLQLKSHYLFDHHFCRVARGNEKGVVEGQVKFTRLNYFVPVPQVRDMAELNAHLRQRCAEDRQRQLRGQPGTKAELLLEDQKAFLPLPPSPFDACRKFLTKASSLSLVRLDGNDYSRCRCVGRIMPSWPKVTAIRSCCVAMATKSRGMCGSGRPSRFALNRSIIWRCWRPNRGLWIMPGHWRVGRCRSVLRCCAEDWRRNERATERGSISKCCVCWSGIRWQSCGPLWRRHYKWEPSRAMPSPSSSIRAKTGGPHCSHWPVIRTCGTSA